MSIHARILNPKEPPPPTSGSNVYKVNKRMMPDIPIPTESDEQISLFQWAEYAAKTMPELVLLYHIPNGGHRYKTTARRLQAEGVKAGVPDLCLPVPRMGFHGLYIEMKRTRGNAATEKQNGWIYELQKQGYKADVCFGWEAAAKLLKEYLTAGVCI